ncbi:MAG: DEAD/DEAH box helicase family protein, partial [Clostridia bacterium]|nr:DEAD/DEAH box helicase family protein [Clostridia bacterium]
MKEIASVRLLDAPFRADRDYDYLLPESGEDPSVGRICLVPFGGGNRGRYAVVVGRKRGESDRPLKRITSLLPEEYRVTEEILSLCFFLREHTLCSVGDAVRAAVPVSAFGLLTEGYFAFSPEKEGEDGLLSYLRRHGGVTEEGLCRVFGSEVKRKLRALVKEGAIVRRTVHGKEMTEKTVKVYSPAVSGHEAALALADPKRVKNEKQAALLRFLLDEGEATMAEIESRLNLSVSPVQALIKQGLVLCEERRVERNPYAHLTKKRDTAPVLLSPAQEKAYATLSSLYGKGEAACALLYGVTGSGKTKVMMRLLDDVLAEGKQAILMVPEIALTPQTVGIFCSRYGEGVAVLHSSLSAGERADAYRKILSGETRLVIGTR